ncbi:MAG: protein-disulfide reductase DsbD N-terminal domain-containing protein [Cytophagaceae bacterium]|nr:protein-disulfide reductase DsbD N-terminal domain-containing protein [Cytophagaceae bacterium]MDW8455313.1 protein-disulfide reductase DsbD family protein [Cytophagaceae bacterium]
MATTYIQAQEFKPVTWTFTFSKTTIKQGETIDVIFSARILQNWYLYSSDFDKDLGPMVTEFSFNEHPSVKLIGSIKPVNAKTKYDSIWGGNITYFTGKAEFRQTVKITGANPIIAGKIYYQVCNDIEGKCIPFDEKFSLTNLKVIAKAPPITSQEAHKPNDIKKDETEKNYTNRITTVAELEQEKKKYSPKDLQGNDIAIQHLKKFVNKYSSCRP